MIIDSGKLCKGERRWPQLFRLIRAPAGSRMLLSEDSHPWPGERKVPDLEVREDTGTDALPRSSPGSAE